MTVVSCSWCLGGSVHGSGERGADNGVEPTKKKLLVTGASGFLGWNVCLRARSEWRVFGVAHSRMVSCGGVEILQVDITEPSDLRKLIRSVKPDAVLHLAAASQPDFCQAHPNFAAKINVSASILLAGLCAERTIPFVFTSSDLVFDGKHAPYREEDPVSPVSIYGEQKVLAEDGILTNYPEAAVCRMSLMFGNPGPASSTFFQSMLRAMEEKRELKLFTDEYRTPLSVGDAVRGLFLALQKVKGVIHLGGKERISRFDFGWRLAEILKVNNARLIPCLQRDVQTAAPRPSDVSLDSSRAFALGFNPGPLEEELKRLLKPDKPG